MTTVEVALVAAGVGLPPVWREPDGLYTAMTMRERGLDHGGPLDLTDEQTAFGVALQLDAWERAAMKDMPFECWAGWMDWPQELLTWRGPGWVASYAEHLLQIAARVAHIGRDHRIRRELGWAVEDGTLATLTAGNGGWVLESGGQRYLFADTSDPGWYGAARKAFRPVHVPALDGITDPTEARAAIDEGLILRRLAGATTGSGGSNVRDHKGA